MAPIEPQASNSKTRAILALGKFQVVYESWRALLGQKPYVGILAAMRQMENYFMKQVDVAQPVDIVPVPDHDDNANLPLDPDAEADNVKEEGEAELPPPHKAILPSNTPAPDIKIEEGVKVEEEELDILLYDQAQIQVGRRRRC